MQGPLNTDNIRAQDGTLVATLTDSTGDISFGNDVVVGNDLDVTRDATIFRNLEVQGPLAEFLQDISVGGDADITGDLSVAGDVEVVNLKITGGSPAADSVLVSDASGNTSWQVNTAAGFASVPTGEKILFYKNTAVLGYSLITSLDDDVVYVTKGSAAGGQSGGAAKPGSSWDHIHPTRSHTLTLSEIPSHRHGPQSPATNFHGNGGPGLVGEGGDSYGAQPYTGYAGGGSSHTHGDTYAPSGSWRPKGQNFTLQQRS